MKRARSLCLAFIVLGACHAAANEKGRTPAEQQELDARQKEADAQREAAIAGFTRRMKEANYPVLFEAAAKEFDVPADILKGVAFAETRWEHLTWPPGETASPETGMPRPYGIMSLWDNEYFGHSLIEAAKLIGKDPEELKRDPFQNMRGGAALLRKIYDETPRPDGSSKAEIEGWRYAIRVYCGIPESDLNASHTLDVFVFMNEGYHQYGIEWDARPVNLEPMRQETRRIVAEERKKRETIQASDTNAVTARPVSPQTSASNPSQSLTPANIAAAATPAPSAPASAHPPDDTNRTWWWLLPGLFLVAVVGLFAYQRRQKPPK